MLFDTEAERLQQILSRLLFQGGDGFPEILLSQSCM